MRVALPPCSTYSHRCHPGCYRRELHHIRDVTKQIEEKLIRNGFVAGGNTPEEQQRFVAAEMKKWAEVARAAKVTSDEWDYSNQSM